MKHKKYLPGFKDALVQLVLDKKKSISEACREANISQSRFFVWRRNYLERTGQMQNNCATNVRPETDQNEIPAVVYFLEEQLQKHLKAADKLRRAIEMLTSKDA